MNTSTSTHEVRDTLRDFSADRRMLLLCAMALVTGTFGAMAAWALVKLIALCTNLAYFHVISSTTVYLTDAHLGPGSILIPVIGGIIVGLIARYGTQKIRGHGIPEALESVLTGGSSIELKVAFWKPLASAIAIGTGGPFGAEGPIIMTGAALGSLFGQCLRLSAAERKTLLAAGAAAGMTGIFGTPVAAILLAIEVMLFE
jgi:H+/Cl- antiporter ClcA